VRAAIVADGLRDREDMGFGERPMERRSAMPAGAEAYQLARIIEIGPTLEKFAFEPGRID
jgi:hypothetical protein